MTSFILISTAMVAVALLLLAPALLGRSKQTLDADTREHNVRIARERLAELEKEYTKGDLSDEEFNQAKQDLEIALAQDLSSSQANAHQQQAGKTTNLITLLALVLIVPLSVTALYQQIGAPQHLELRGPGQPVAQQSAPDIGQLVTELEKRLQANPDNPQGWFLLGRTYMRLGRYNDAVRAYETLQKSMPDDASVKLSLADALAMQNGGQLNARGAELLQQVLQTEPNSITALWLLGQYALQQSQVQEALGYWQRAYPLLQAEPEAQQQLGARIAELQQQAGIDPVPVKPAVTDQTNVSASLRVTVALDPAWQEKVAPSDIVFIYAKALQGPPMPLAVARKRVSDLPVEVILDDSMAMLPQMKLSAFDQVLVGARISKTGQAMPQAGDLQSAEVEAKSQQSEKISLLINQLKE